MDILTKEMSEKDALIKRHERIIEENQEKIDKVNRLVVEYEGYRVAIKDLNHQKEALVKRCQNAEKYGSSITDVVKKLKQVEVKPSNFLKLMDNTLEKLEKYEK